MRGTSNIFTRARTYVPADLSTVEVDKLIKQQSRNRDFWDKLLHLSRKSEVPRVRPGSQLDNTLDDVAKLARGDTTVEQFFKDYPDYKCGLSVTETEFKAILAETISDTETLTMRCWDILMLSSFTSNMVNMSVEG